MISCAAQIYELSQKSACKNLCQYRYLFSNPQHLVIWHLSGPVDAGLKEFAVIITKLPDVREMNDNSSFVSATNEVFVMEFCLSSLKLSTDTLCRIFICNNR